MFTRPPMGFEMTCWASSRDTSLRHFIPVATYWQRWSDAWRRHAPDRPIT